MNQLLLTDTVRNLLRFSEIQTDHGVFKLHYKLTATLLFSCSILVSATQFFGDPILCSTFDGIIPTAVMNNYCWIEGTFTVRRALNGTLGEDVAAPGVDQRKLSKDDPIIEHSYYQWVSLFLFLQAIAFYLPRWVWCNYEKGRMKKLISELSKPVLEDSEKRKRFSDFVQYFITHSDENEKYAMLFFRCELLTMANVLLQLYLLDRFLGFQFWNYGLETIMFLGNDPEVRIDPMIKVFPKMTKCRLKRFGTSGEVQIHDAICLLSLNVLNEKIFVLLWFWLVFLTVMTVFNIIYRLFVMRAQKLRYRMLSTLARMLRKTDLKDLEGTAKYGDWFMLSMLKENVKAHHFKEIVHEICREINSRKF